MSEDASGDAPSGFEPLARVSPFVAAIGPVYHRPGSDPFVVGLRILDRHANLSGVAHGGLLMTLADVALGYAAAFREEPPALLVTVSLSADFAGSARIGDWVEAHVDVQKSGRRLAFANLFLVAEGRRILRASAVFARADGGRAPSRRLAEADTMPRAGEREAASALDLAGTRP